MEFLRMCAQCELLSKRVYEGTSKKEFAPLILGFSLISHCFVWRSESFDESCSKQFTLDNNDKTSYYSIEFPHINPVSKAPKPLLRHSKFSNQNFYLGLHLMQILT